MILVKLPLDNGHYISVFHLTSFIWLRFFLQGGAGTVHRKNTELCDFFTNRVYFILWNKEKLSMTES